MTAFSHTGLCSFTWEFAGAIPVGPSQTAVATFPEEMCGARYLLCSWANKQIHKDIPII